MTHRSALLLCQTLDLAEQKMPVVSWQVARRKVLDLHSSLYEHLLSMTGKPVRLWSWLFMLNMLDEQQGLCLWAVRYSVRRGTRAWSCSVGERTSDILLKQKFKEHQRDCEALHACAGHHGRDGQMTLPMALIPLVKGAQWVALNGDLQQLQPFVQTPEVCTAALQAQWHCQCYSSANLMNWRVSPKRLSEENFPVELADPFITTFTWTKCTCHCWRHWRYEIRLDSPWRAHNPGCQAGGRWPAPPWRQ